MRNSFKLVVCLSVSLDVPFRVQHGAFPQLFRGLVEEDFASEMAPTPWKAWCLWAKWASPWVYSRYIGLIWGQRDIRLPMNQYELCVWAVVRHVSQRLVQRHKSWCWAPKKCRKLAHEDHRIGHGKKNAPADLRAVQDDERAYYIVCYIRARIVCYIVYDLSCHDMAWYIVYDIVFTFNMVYQDTISHLISYNTYHIRYNILYHILYSIWYSIWYRIHSYYTVSYTIPTVNLIWPALHRQPIFGASKFQLPCALAPPHHLCILHWDLSG